MEVGGIVVVLRVGLLPRLPALLLLLLLLLARDGHVDRLLLLALPILPVGLFDLRPTVELLSNIGK